MPQIILPVLWRNVSIGAWSSTTGRAMAYVWDEQGEQMSGALKEAPTIGKLPPLT